MLEEEEKLKKLSSKAKGVKENKLRSKADEKRKKKYKYIKESK